MVQINLQRNILSLAIAVLATAAYLLIIGVSSASAQQMEKQSEPPATPSSTAAATAFNYVAQPGDSYSLLARKAIQTYGIVNNVKLTQAEIIAAETNLTQELGSSQLAIGQKTTVQAPLVKKWIEAAQKLTPQQKAAWQVYVPLVDFNTNNVGEARR